MLRIILKLTVVLNVISLYACISTAAPVTDGYEIKNINEGISPTSQASSATPTPKIAYMRTNFSCATFLVTKWGNGLNEFGYQNESFSPELRPGPYAPTFDEQGNMFVADIMNKRILKYPRNDKTSEVIPVPEQFTLEFGSFILPWSNISVSHNKIFFLAHARKNERHIRQLAMLSVDNGDIMTIDLDHYYPMDSVSSSPVVADRQGGAYILLDKAVVHYDADFRPELYITTGEFFGDFVIGWDGDLYTYEHDLVKNWGKSDSTFALQTNEPKIYFQDVKASLSNEGVIYVQLLGVDSIGRLYFLLFHNKDSGKEGEIEVVRFDASGNKGIIGQIGIDWHSFNYSVAPNGSLYSIMFNPQNPSVQPKIIKCSF